VVNALWGFSFPVVKALNEMADLHFGIASAAESTTFRVLVSSWMIAVRFSIALLLLVVLWNRLFREATRQEWLAGCYIGWMFYLGLLLQVIGLATIPASRSGFLTSLTAVFTPLFAVLIFRRFPSRWIVAGAVLAVLGVVVLTGLIVFEGNRLQMAEDAADRWTLGDSLTTAGSMFFAFQVLLLDHFGKRVRSISVTPGMFLTTAILGWLTTLIILATPLRASTGVPAIHFGDWWSLTIQPAYLVLLFALASFCSLLSFGWMNKYQPAVTASQAAVIYSLEPVFASSWALFLPQWLGGLTGLIHENEQVTWSLLAGGVMILIANVVALYPSPNPSEESESVPR
jgi:drug/metabolite transporter (DMT)-like permease